MEQDTFSTENRKLSTWLCVSGTLQVSEVNPSNLNCIRVSCVENGCKTNPEKSDLEKKAKLVYMQCRSRLDGSYEPSHLDLDCLSRAFSGWLKLGIKEKT